MENIGLQWIFPCGRSEQSCVSTASTESDVMESSMAPVCYPHASLSMLSVDRKATEAQILAIECGLGHSYAAVAFARE
jgi:hypothetical protein